MALTLAKRGARKSLKLQRNIANVIAFKYYE